MTILSKPLLIAVLVIASAVLSALAYEHRQRAAFTRTVTVIHVEDTAAALKAVKDR